MRDVTQFCFFASYLVAFLLDLTRLAGRSRIVQWVAVGFAVAGFLAHTIYLVVRSRATDLPPLLASAHDWLLVLAWLGVLAYLGVTVYRRGELAIGLFILPPVTLLVGAAYFVSDSPSERPDAGYWWGMLHASLLVTAIAGVLIGFATSLMYLVQHWRLKTKRAASGSLALFSLEQLGRINWWAIVVSVPLLALGMATGVTLVIMSQSTDEPISLLRWDFLLDGLLLLGMCGLFYWLMSSRRPGGKEVAWRTMWACGSLLVTIVLLQMLGNGPHGQGV